MRIVHCLIHYLPEYIAGTEIYTHTLARLQLEAGHEVSVITPHIDYHLPGQMKGHYVYESINVYQYLETANPNDRRYYDGRKIPEGLTHFSELIQQLNPDVVHFHQLNRGVGLSIEHVKKAKTYGAKVFITMHLSFYTCNTNLLIYRNQMCDGIIDPITCSACSLNRFYGIPDSVASATARLGRLGEISGLTRFLGNTPARTMLSFPKQIKRLHKDLLELGSEVNRVVCISSWYRDVLTKNGIPEHKIALVPQALPGIAEFPEVQEGRQNTQLPLRLVFIGRIQWQKGLHLLIECCSKFSGSQLSLDIYGKPEDTDYCRGCISASKGCDHIFWRGRINQSEVIATLSKYDLLCLPSQFSEMSPLVIQEAFMAGTPVLASRVYGNSEQITDEQNGLLFEFNSLEDLSRQVTRLIHHPERIAELRSSIRQPSPFSTIVKKYFELYTCC